MENKTKIILVVLVLLVVCGVGIQMFMSPDAVNSSGNQTVTDMANKSLEKIVADKFKIILETGD